MSVRDQNAKTQEAMRARAAAKRARRAKQLTPQHSEERPGMGCGDPACKEHYPLPEPFPAKEVRRGG